jgi:hypothetical protein
MIKQRAKRAYGGKDYVFLTLSVDAGEWPHVHCDHFTHGGRASGRHWTVGLASPKRTLDVSATSTELSRSE